MTRRESQRRISTTRPSPVTMRTPAEPPSAAGGRER
jgi:hypothetical protein